MHATLQKGLHWSKVLTARLNKDVKLVGCTISCESAYMGGIASSEARHNAHVQSYVIATDQVQSFPSHAPLLHLLESCKHPQEHISMLEVPAHSDCSS